VDRPGQPRNSQGVAEIRIIVNPTIAGRTVDHGPSAELKKEAAAFRSFWGEKAELRRFKDGSILETLVWPSDASDLSITQQIMIYVLKRHVHSGVEKSIKFVMDPFGKILPGSTMSGQASLRPFQPLTTAYDELAKAIRDLEGLPLQLRQVSGAGPALRYSSMYPPSNAKDSLSEDPVDVVVNFEGSGRWPDDLVAIQRTKIALLLKMGELLEASLPGVIARVGLENQKHLTLNAAFLDVIYRGGRVAFRLRIQNEREQTLNERSVQNKTLSPQQREEAAVALAAYKRTFVHAPSHAQSICMLCTRFPLLSQTIRLAKKWFSAHLLALHFADEFIELVVAHTFTQPGPWHTPSSVASGFLRTLLFLSRWDWRGEPLIVDLSGDGGGLAAGDVEAMVTRFEAWRKIDPALNRVVLFVASNLDADGVTWTQAGPSKVVAARMTTLARAACALVHDSGVGLNAWALFKSPLTDYDFLLHLHPRFTKKGSSRTATNEHAAAASTAITTTAPAATDGAVELSEEDVQLVGYKPVLLFIEELKVCFLV
jgi:U3 small nucleolar RNA-associated protein 22